MIGWKIRNPLPPIRIDEDRGPELADVAKAAGTSDEVSSLRGRLRQRRRSFAARPQTKVIGLVRRFPPRQKGTYILDVV